jgi:hypothetical protein
MTDIQKTTRRPGSLSEATTQTSMPAKRLSWGVMVLALLLVIALGAAGYFYYQLKWAPQIESAQEIEDLTKTIGAFIELPQGETPTLATVTDREKLADQTFFLKAENGDKVLIYSNSGKAILYRPSTKKVIDMTTVNVAQSEAAGETQGTPTTPEQQAEVKTATVALYNGSTKNAVTGPLEEKLKTQFSFVTITQKETAKKNDYQGTMIVNVSGNHGAEAKSLAEYLGGTVVDLPEGETKPQADIVVIIGNESTASPVAGE